MDLSRVAWRKSSHSQGNGGECVELAAAYADAAIAVRDSKNPGGPKLVFSTRAWSAFVGTVKDGSLISDHQ